MHAYAIEARNRGRTSAYATDTPENLGTATAPIQSHKISALSMPPIRPCKTTTTISATATFSTAPLIITSVGSNPPTRFNPGYFRRPGPSVIKPHATSSDTTPSPSPWRRSYPAICNQLKLPFGHYAPFHQPSDPDNRRGSTKAQQPPNTPALSLPLIQHRKIWTLSLPLICPAKKTAISTAPPTPTTIAFNPGSFR